jgi:hypothetical protein
VPRCNVALQGRDDLGAKAGDVFQGARAVTGSLHEQQEVVDTGVSGRLDQGVAAVFSGADGV